MSTVVRSLSYHRNGAPQPPNAVCVHWLAGQCTRKPCPFFHPQPTPSKPLKKVDTVCSFWARGSCRFGDSCMHLHSWSTADWFSLSSTLRGHDKSVTGVALPSDSDYVYTGGKDGCMIIWDRQSGQCLKVCELGGEVGCMMSEGPFVFVGLPNMVKVFNTETQVEQNLSGPIGQVQALAEDRGLLFAGTQSGDILCWKFNSASNCYDPLPTPMKGHTRSVVSLNIGANRLFSGSMDKTIKMWNLETLECMEQTLTGHTSAVTSLVCWDLYLLSGSLDKTIKIWAATERGTIEVAYTHTLEHGLLSLSALYDPQGKAVLLCSCSDNTVRMYELPSFMERGKVVSTHQIRSVTTVHDGLPFSTGDGAGNVNCGSASPDLDKFCTGLDIVI